MTPTRGWFYPYVSQLFKADKMDIKEFQNLLAELMRYIRIKIRVDRYRSNKSLNQLTSEELYENEGDIDENSTH